MNRTILMLGLLGSAVAVGASAMGQEKILVQNPGYEWVQPGEYTFGNCGRVNGGRVPATLQSGQKYYNQFSCRAAYTTVDVCLQHSRQIEFNLRQYDTYQQCSGWLRSELDNCRRYIRNAVNWCDKLAN